MLILLINDYVFNTLIYREKFDFFSFLWYNIPTFEKGCLVMKKRIFIGSDFHGQGNVYFGLINYLENLQMKNPEQKIILYINGDIIDRGSDSMEMFLDVMERVKGRKGNIEVHMMAGNHELMMYEAIKAKRRGRWVECGWLYPSNGGHVTRDKFEKLVEEKQKEVTKFLRDLPISFKFNGSLVGKDGIVLAHACPPKVMKNLDVCNYDLNFAYIDEEISNCLWLRKKDMLPGESLGLENNLVIVGHTKNGSRVGYKYDDKDCVLNIDGGCANYEVGDSLIVPIVELDYCMNKANIIGFDENGKIVYKKVFAEDGVIKNPNNKDKVTRNNKPSGGKYYDGSNKTLDLLVSMKLLAETKVDEFVSFVSTNKRKLAALGLLVGTLGSVGSIVGNDKVEDNMSNTNISDYKIVSDYFEDSDNALIETLDEDVFTNNDNKVLIKDFK